MGNKLRRSDSHFVSEGRAGRLPALFLHLACTSLLLLALCGCQEGAMPIAEILDDPEPFKGQFVVLTGEVVGPAELPSSEHSFYTLRDETGRISVLTDGALPEEGSWIDVCGEVKLDLTIAERSFPVYIDEARRCEIDEFWIDARIRVFKAFDSVRRTLSGRRPSLPF